MTKRAFKLNALLVLAESLAEMASDDTCLLLDVSNSHSRMSRRDHAAQHMRRAPRKTPFQLFSHEP